MLHYDLIHLICLYVPKYVLPDWVKRRDISWACMSKNPNAIDFLMENRHKIHLKTLCMNPNATELLKESINQINWNKVCLSYVDESILNLIFDKIEESDSLSNNVNAIELLKKNPSKIYWSNLCANPAAIEILENNINKLTSNVFANPDAIKLIERLIRDPKIKNNKNTWYYLCQNPNAMHIIKANMDKINWESLSLNPSAIDILENNLDKVSWLDLSRNPGAIHILKNNWDEINWSTAVINRNFMDLFDDPRAYEYYNRSRRYTNHVILPTHDPRVIKLIMIHKDDPYMRRILYESPHLFIPTFNENLKSILVSLYKI